MRRRLRKKKYVGEFVVYGFELGFHLRCDLSSNGRNGFIDRFLAQAIEDNRLLFGGGGDHEWNGFAVARESRRSASETQRQAVRGWLETAAEVVEAHVGPLRDANSAD